MNSKASKNELNTKLTNKPSHAEMNSLFQEFINKLNSRLETSYLNSTYKIISLIL